MASASPSPSPRTGSLSRSALPGASSLRIGLAFHGDPLDPAAWSGTPAGIAAGLRAAGHEVVGLSARPSASVDRSAQRLLALPRMLPEVPAMLHGQSPRTALGHAKSVARIGMGYRALGTLSMRRAQAAAGELDLVVRLGTSFEVHHPRVITFEDLTVQQVLGAGWPDWSRLDPLSQRLRIRAQRRSFDQALVCCTATPWTARSVVQDYGQPSEKVFPVGLGANHAIETSGEKDWTRPRFLFVGKDWEDKNGPVLLAAFERFHRSHPRAHLDLVGHHPAVDHPGITGHGFLRLSEPEPRAVMARLYGEATCLVVPTSFEPAGIVHVEAAAAGVPSIGSGLGGAADMIGPSGVTVVPGDVEDLVSAMERMADPETARSMGEAGRERAHQFTWERVGRRILQAAGLAEREEADWAGLWA